MQTAQIEQHRADLGQLIALALAELARLVERLKGATETRDALLDSVPQVVRLYGSASATLGADWYDDVREQASVPRAFRAVPAELPDLGRTDSLVRWGVEPLFNAEPNMPAVFERVGGGLQRILADADRATIAQSAVADPSAVGWQRVGNGACAFCRMLIARGAVYREATARFASHDHCNCAAVPKFGGDSVPVGEYRRSTRNIPEADKARVRRYLAANPDT